MADEQHTPRDAFAATVAADSSDKTLPMGARDPALDATTLKVPVADEPLDATTLPVLSGDRPSPSLPTSAKIGRFVVLRKLGEGGMGVVMVGYDESLDRKAAVKVLHRGAAAQQWLMREAQALAKLSHPNVVPVYEVGEHEGRVFLAMEYVEGRTLSDFLEEGSHPLVDVLRMFVQAGRGLVAAHDAGLVHRDFKPDNVLVGKDGRARVVDFGIASLAERDGPAGVVKITIVDQPISASPTALASPLTVAGALMGTPLYMSPEQFKSERATAASDQFSFCVSLYEAVYDQFPFEGETLYELAASVCSGKIAPPPSKSQVPGWLRDVLARGLAVRPEDRFPSLAALLDAIDAKLPKGEEDPSVVRREQVMLFGILLVYAAAITAYTAWRGMDAYTPVSACLYGLIYLVVSAVGVALVWKGLRRNAFGRRFAFLVLGVPIVVLAHRLVELGLGASVHHILALDSFLLALAFTLATLMIDRRFAWVAGVASLATVVATVHPERALSFFGAVGLVGLGTGVFLWGGTRAKA